MNFFSFFFLLIFFLFFFWVFRLCLFRCCVTGEIKIQIDNNIRGSDVFVIQPTCAPNINDHVVELLLLLQTLQLSSAKRITAVVPYFGYARQDRKTKARVPISAAAIATMIETMGAHRVLVVDLHCGQIQVSLRLLSRSLALSLLPFPTQHFLFNILILFSLLFTIAFPPNKIFWVFFFFSRKLKISFFSFFLVFSSQGFFRNIPVDNLFAENEFIAKMEELNLDP